MDQAERRAGPETSQAKACAHCGREFRKRRTVSAAVWAKARFCSVACNNKARGKAKPSLVERFWARVTSRDPDECWEWGGHLGSDGYGVLSTSHSTHVRAHRFSLELKLGRRLLAGHCACHTCDNRKCVNPAHLVEGSRADNNRDMFAKGRGRPQGLTLPPRQDLPVLTADGGVE